MALRDRVTATVDSTLKEEPIPSTIASSRTAGLVLTPLQLLDRLAALLPPPRLHRHFGAGANGRSQDMFAATINGNTWPTAPIGGLRR